VNILVSGMIDIQVTPVDETALELSVPSGPIPDYSNNKTGEGRQYHEWRPWTVISS
jgi:hypothetical protein